MRRPKFLIPALLAALLAVSGLKLGLDAVPRKRVPGAGLSYVPSGKYLKAATFGYASFVADVLFVWAIQYYGNPEIEDKFARFEHIFSILAELDPRWVDPYQVGALIALYDAEDPRLSLKMFDLGASKNPKMWIFPLEAGHYAQLYLKDYALAKDYYRKAMAIPGAPAIAKRLYANAAFQTMDLETSWKTWTEVYETSDDPQIRKIASNHLYRIKAAADISRLSRALSAYRERYGTWPGDLDRLGRAGFLNPIPKDLDGRDYVYDPKTGEVRTAVIPWKR
jgi:tetratricopeptide (TPR) repeat protein